VDTNTLAYFDLTSVTKKNSFITLTPGQSEASSGFKLVANVDNDDQESLQMIDKPIITADLVL
jgi:hypothetical protein